MSVKATNLVIAHGSEEVISASSFALPAGRVTAVIGPNGSGKSTLLDAIAGLVTPKSGTLEVAAAPGRIAYVLQNPQVNESLPITVNEVVAMGRYSSTGWLGRLGRADRDAVESAMARAGILDFSRRQLHDLSAGQRQRVFVAQGLTQDHDLLLLDEPLSGIDLPTAQAIDTLIHEETGRGCTVILTTHDLAEARAADFVLLLASKVVASGVPAAVLNNESLRAAYGSVLVHADEAAGLFDDPAHHG